MEKFLIAAPADIDGDCIDDVTELGDPAGLNPVNRAPTVYLRDGAVAIPDRATFEALSYKGRSVPYHGYLRDLEFLKFYIARVNSSRPMVYFINTNTHPLHPDFWRAVHGFGSQHSSDLLAGEIVFHPNAVAPDGSLGVYRFEYKSWHGYHFDQISMINDVLAASMPLLENNLAYHPRTEEMKRAYRQEQALFDASRVNVLLAEDILPDVPFLPLNVGQGYGFLRIMSLEERPDPRDVVIYETLPNELSPGLPASSPPCHKRRCRMSTCAPSRTASPTPSSATPWTAATSMTSLADTSITQWARAATPSGPPLAPKSMPTMPLPSPRRRRRRSGT